MIAALDASPTMPAKGRAKPAAPTYRRTCQECSTDFFAAKPNQLFCCREHKRAYNNRWMKRGAVLAPLAVAARYTRNGTRGDKATGSRANTDANRLMERWKQEDEAAGRIFTVDYVANRYRLGLVEFA